MFMAIVNINIKAIKLDDITVTFHPKRPRSPVIIITEKKTTAYRYNYPYNLLKTYQRVATINKKTPSPKTIMSFLIKVIISSAIIGMPPK